MPIKQHGNANKMTGSTISKKIRRAVSQNKDTVLAAQELVTDLQPDPDDTVICFSGPNHSSGILHGAFSESFGDTQLIACRTAGEITPSGYIDNSLTAVVLPSGLFTTEIVTFKEVEKLSLQCIANITRQACSHLAGKVGSEYKSSHCFAMLLVDGLSMREEVIAAGINSGLDGMPLFGGSSADDVTCNNAWIYSQDEMQNNIAVLILVHTTLPFKVFKTEHFSCGSEAFVTTEIDAGKRLILKVDDYPAAEWYAKTIGVELSTLSPEIFSKYPITVKSGGHTYVRSIQSVKNNGALCFYCAVDEGMIIHIGHQGDLYDNLQKAISNVSEQVGGIELLISCDCLLRTLEARQKNLMPALSDLFIKNNAIGFSTFGEQLDGIHINQTFTAIAIGSRGA